MYLRFHTQLAVGVLAVGVSLGSKDYLLCLVTREDIPARHR